MSRTGWIVRGVAVLAGGVLVAQACGGGDTSDGRSRPGEAAATPRVFPGDEWARGDPEELGFDPEALEALASELDDDSHCLLVIRHGQVAAEWYWNGYTADESEIVHSVTQAYSSTLVGIAQDEGLLDIDDKVSEYVPEWIGTPAEDVTIRNILSHDSGRRSTDGIRDAELHSALITAEDPAAFALGLDQAHPPGTVWSQNLPAIEILNPVLRSATGQDPARYARTRLFDPIGSRHTTMDNGAGRYSWMHSFLRSTCRDAARLGYLFLQSGNWDGTQIVSEEWVAEATHPTQELQRRLGFMWWLNYPGSLVSSDNMATPDYDAAPSDLQLLPEAPEDMYWALGLGGMVVQVHPTTDTVLVRLGEGDIDAVQDITRIVTHALQPH